MNDQILAELKKLNEFLAKIDWKLWNMHQKYLEETAVSANTSTQPTSAAPEAKNRSEAPEAPPALPKVPKYPSIEKWD
jgi:hypothetical protein